MSARSSAGQPAGITAAPPIGATPATQAETRPGHIRARRLTAVIAAATAAAGVWAVAGPLAGVQLMARVSAHGPAQQVGPASVVIMSLLAGLAAWALLALLERHASHPRRTWTAVAATVLAISLAGPLTAGRGIATVTALCGMHLAVGAVLILAMRRTARG
jgi:Family of unknown function (DUF6069)